MHYVLQTTENKATCSYNDVQVHQNNHITNSKVTFKIYTQRRNGM